MDCQIVTIDGKRGTGKSRLASSLRNCFDCGVLDIGPIFRLLTWFTLTGKTSDPEDACELLSELWSPQSALSIHLDSGGAMSATKIELDNRDLEGDLWRPEIDDFLPMVSQNDAVVEHLCSLVRAQIGSRPTIMVGRNTGMHLFPDALLKIRLIAEEAVRTHRKMRQLQAELSDNEAINIERSEPLLAHLDFKGYFTIDTSHLTPDQVLRTAKDIISSRVHWKRTDT